VPKSSGRSLSFIWLAAFGVLPLSVWVAAARASGFEGKRLSNLSLEPALVLFSSCAVCLTWFLVARKGLRPLTGLALLIILSAGAFAVQRFVPALRE
jgi:hypothetical protein